jgi:thiol-disulfide isomerase/thioredoxin
MKPLHLSSAVGIGVFALALLGVAAAAVYFGLLGGGPATPSPAAEQPAAQQIETQPTTEEASTEVGLDVGDLAPDFSLPDLGGGSIALADFRGRQAVMINFWASWCAPCKAEMPHLDEVYREYQGGLVVLGINLLEDAPTIREFLGEVSVSYPIMLDRQGEVARLYRLFTQPVTYFIDGRGVIVDRKFGAFTREELRERVKMLLDANPIRPEERDALPDSSVDVELLEDVASKLSYFSESEMTKFLKTPGMAEVDPMRVPYVADLDRDLLKPGCPFVDCIPSIDGPEFEAADEASGWLQPDDLVLGLSRNGIARAYPIKILNWHEIVNDRFGDEPIAITYCPLCNSGVAFRSTLGDEVLELGVSGRLYKSDLVMYDRQTGSFWSQIEGRAIVGLLAGQQLEQVPIDVLPWSDWRASHPDTTVLARPTTRTRVGGKPPLAERREQAKRGGPRPIGGGGSTSDIGEFLRDYSTDPYAWYRVNNADTFGTPLQDRRLEAKTEVWGLMVGGQPKAYHGPSLRRAGALNDEVGGEPILVLSAGNTARAFKRRLPSGEALTFEREGNMLIDRETGSRWTLDGTATDGPLAGTQLRPLVVTSSYWFAWVAFHPSTELFLTDEVDEGDEDSAD